MNNPYSAFVPPGHYYSPLPDLGEAEAHLQMVLHKGILQLPGICNDATAQFSFLSHLVQSHLRHFQFPEFLESNTATRYYRRNGFFESGDAFLLFAILREYSPKRIVEVGSGFSSALMLDTIDMAKFECSLSFVEPCPDRLNALLRPADHELFPLKLTS